MTQVSLILVNFTNFKKLIEAKVQLPKRGLQRLHNGGTTKIILIILLLFLCTLKSYIELSLHWSGVLISLESKWRHLLRTHAYIFFNLQFSMTKKWRLYDSAGWNKNSYKWVYEVFSKAIWCQIFRKSITLHARLRFPILLLLCTLVLFQKSCINFKK